MAKISRDSEVMELNDPPVFNFGEKVRALRTIRNDGTYCGREIGDVLVKKGEQGYVVHIGSFLQQFYIYGVEFIESGTRVGMKRKELEAVEAPEEIPLPELGPANTHGIAALVFPKASGKARGEKFGNSK
ncbi:MAG: nitrogen fixation protein NifZ [Steroidobacteraceae bacterium]